MLPFQQDPDPMPFHVDSVKLLVSYPNYYDPEVTETSAEFRSSSVDEQRYDQWSRFYP